MILGVAGPYGAGKGVLVGLLEERSFLALSLSDEIRDELRARGVPETREKMIEMGRELREKEGADVLAIRVLRKLPTDRNCVVDSIRHPAEVEALRSAGRVFRLIWIDADAEVRLNRVRGRARPGDPGSLAEMLALEARETNSSDPSGQKLAGVRALADELVTNSGSLEDLRDTVQEILRRNLYFERPGWDEYFMRIAEVVASRSNCVKRKVAALITVDRRIISTGYNGTPRGVRNCNEGGCPRCNDFARSGEALSECLCSHGEENALTQAAYHGVSVKGGTLYSTFCPCLLCTKMIINAGITEVVYRAGYPMESTATSLLESAGITVRQMQKP